ncbi:acetate/propionate family kinase [Demequina pelophila]|uniref:acetate/propionate family kinase n=1 Tax=Demequina pelophila TaxID=1638984 RepID=UPI0007821248|nr:acetate kinase [Demequina pelophila]
MTNGIALVLNCGSSSVKYQVVDTAQEAPLASGIVERVQDHTEAIREVMTTLEADENVDLAAITVVGHRVVQGGDIFTEATVVTEDVEAKIDELGTLAPLHNPANLKGIRAAKEAFPGLAHVAVFDTAFHTTMPAPAYTYAIDKDVAAQYKIRRYGAHGTSHAFVSQAVAELVGRPVEELKTVVLHLGNGASATAVDGGKSVDTSMGLTPLEGLMMGTRSGDIDPAALIHLGRQGWTFDQLDDLLNRKSGFIGLTGMSDMRDIETAFDAGNADAQLARHVYAHRIKGYVGKYMAVMGGLDTIVFTAGIGENDSAVRLECMQGLEGLGIVIDPERNAGRKKVATLISTDDSPVQIWVVPTNEERAIALQSIAAAA